MCPLTTIVLTYTPANEECVATGMPACPNFNGAYTIDQSANLDVKMNDKSSSDDSDLPTSDSSLSGSHSEDEDEVEKQLRKSKKSQQKGRKAAGKMKVLDMNFKSASTKKGGQKTKVAVDMSDMDSDLPPSMKKPHVKGKRKRIMMIDSESKVELPMHHKKIKVTTSGKRKRTAMIDSESEVELPVPHKKIKATTFASSKAHLKP